MFEIKMTIEIPGLPEALNALAGAIGKQPEFVCHQHGGNNHHIDNAGVVNVDFPAAPAPVAPVVNLRHLFSLRQLPALLRPPLFSRLHRRLLPRLRRSPLRLRATPWRN